MKITLDIDKALIEQLDANRDKIRDHVQQVVRQKADVLRAEIGAGMAETIAAYHALDWMDYMEKREPRYSIRIVTEHPPYIGGGIITTLHTRRKH